MVEVQENTGQFPDHSVTEIISSKRREVIRGGARDDRYIQVAPVRAARKKLSKLTSLEKEAALKVPLDTLAKEWLSTLDIDLTVKRFLVDSLLPTLVIGLEKLLNEVTLRELADSTDRQEDFNPINYLAQFLMRNNPLYSRQNWDHAYVKAMRQTTEEVKELLGSLENKKLEELREQSRQRSRDREKQAAAKMEEHSRKVQQLKTAYSKWLGPEETAPPLTEMKAVLQSWAANIQDDAVKSGAEVFVASLSPALLGIKWQEKDFVKAIVKLELPEQPFEELVGHVTLCGLERKRRLMQDKRREQIQAVFNHCTLTTNSSTVDRLRIVYLLTCYYDSQSPEVQQLVLNPREWPIMEVVELEELEEEEEQQRLSSAPMPLSQQDLAEFLEGGEEGMDKSGGREDELAEDIVTPTVGGEEGNEKMEQIDEGTTQGDGEKGEDQEVEGDPPSIKEVGEDSKSPPDPDGGTSHTPSSLLEQRLPTSSKTRVKSLRRMRLVSGMSPQCLLQPAGPGGCWDHEQLTKGQFVVLVEQFLGLEPEQAILNTLLLYIRDNYKETMDERRDRLEQAKHMEQQLHHRRCIEELFLLWDNNHSGFIDLSDFVNILIKWKGFEDEDTWSDAQLVLESLEAEHRLTRQQFCSYLHQITAQMSHAQFLSLTDFLRTSVQLTQEEERRSKMRKQWLDELVKGGKTSDLKLGITLKSAVSIVHQDANEFGGTKQVTVVISLLQKSHAKLESTDVSNPSSTPPLRVNAASSSLQPDIIGALLPRSGKGGVSFMAVDDRRPVHVASIKAHGGVHFYIPSHNSDQFDGSLIVVPVQTPPGTAVGVISIDSLHRGLPPSVRDRVAPSTADTGKTQTPLPTSGSVVGQAPPSADTAPLSADTAPPSAIPDSSSSLPVLSSSFRDHEVLFYQGVGQCVGQVHHWISCRLSLLRVSLSALRWIHNHCPSVKRGEVYLVTAPPTPPAGNKDSFLLHLMLSTSPSGPPTTKINQRVKKQDAPFKSYLFECVEMSEPFSTEIFGERHLVHPIRDNTGCAVALVDLTLTPIQLAALDRGQLREITKVLNLLTSTFYYLNSSWEDPKGQLEGEVWQGLKQQLTESEDGNTTESDADFNSLFNELILEDLRKRMQRIDNMVFAELRSYVDPPKLVLQVVQALLNLLHPDKECETWTQCKQMITVSMVRAMMEYNPLRVPKHPKLDTIKELITSVPVGAVYEHGSLPTKFIHRWIRACIPILEHSAASVTP